MNLNILLSIETAFASGKPSNEQPQLFKDGHLLHAVDKMGGQIGYSHNSYRYWGRDIERLYNSVWAYAFIKDETYAVINGDQEDEGVLKCPTASLVESCIKDHKIFKNSPTISFICVARLLGFKNTYDIGYLFYNKTIEILDFTPDIILSSLQEERNKARKIAIEKGISRAAASRIVKPGFTLIIGPNGNDLVWHQASTCLIKYRNKHYILGQDEGSYFGCELKGKPITIKAAFEDMKPTAAKNKKGVLRQGEWFAVPTKNVPPINWDTFSQNTKSGFGSFNITLPKENESSNDHVIISPSDWQQPTEIRINQGIIYLMGHWSIEHTDHEPMKPEDTKQWYALYRNTVKQSVSTQGVD